MANKNKNIKNELPHDHEMIESYMGLTGFLIIIGLGTWGLFHALFGKKDEPQIKQYQISAPSTLPNSQKTVEMPVITTGQDIVNSDAAFGEENTTPEQPLEIDSQDVTYLRTNKPFYNAGTIYLDAFIRDHMARTH